MTQMKKIVPLILLVLAVTGYFIFSGASCRAAPDVSMTNLNGNVIETLQRNNKPLLMTFWATTCSSCVKEMPHLVELQNRYSQSIDIVGVAMSYDNIEHIHNIIKRRSLNYNIVFDQTGDIAQSFGGIRLTPTSFLISAQGQIVYQKIGDIDFDKLEKDLNTLNKQG